MSYGHVLNAIPNCLQDLEKLTLDTIQYKFELR